MPFSSPYLPASPLWLLLIAYVACLAYLRSRSAWRARTQNLSLPPGPVPLPVFGNVFQLPKVRPWLGFREMCHQYGGLLYLRVFSQGLLVIGDAQLAIEFLERHSARTSDRPLSPVIALSGQDFNFGLFPYGPKWRRHRREFWQFFNPGAVARYQPIQRAKTHKFLGKLLNSPSRLQSHIQQLFTSAIDKVLYDIDIVREDDERITIPHAALEAIRRATPGRFAVETFLFLGRIPAWFPGAEFQKIFAECKVGNDYLKHAVFGETRDSLERGEEHPCVVADMLKRARGTWTGDSMSKEDEETLKNVCATAVDGGSDTTYSFLQALFVAMALNPDVQKKAQAELDAVVGPDRLPDFSDCDALVYVNAVVKETHRWNAILPLGLPRVTTSDEELNGYFIPAGTTVIPNTWAILHDSEAYEDPDEFRPERFIGRDGRLDPSVRDPSDFAFGFGRRICAGRYFAHSSLFITTASVLHVFNITPPVDENGEPVPLTFQQTHGVLSYPEDCRCTVKPRSAAAEALIRDAQAEVESGVPI